MSNLREGDRSDARVNCAERPLTGRGPLARFWLFDFRRVAAILEAAAHGPKDNSSVGRNIREGLFFFEIGIVSERSKRSLFLPRQWVTDGKSFAPRPRADATPAGRAT